MLSYFVNGFSNWLSDGPIGRRLRVALFRACGVSIGAHSWICGGGCIPIGALVVGSNCYINRGCYIDLTGSITLGNNVVLGHGVTLITARHAIGSASRRAGAVGPTEISIGSGSWLGSNTTVLPGVKIGAGCIIAAGAVVTNDLPDNTLSAGVPARIIRELSIDE